MGSVGPVPGLMTQTSPDSPDAKSVTKALWVFGSPATLASLLPTATALTLFGVFSPKIDTVPELLLVT